MRPFLPFWKFGKSSHSERNLPSVQRQILTSIDVRAFSVGASFLFDHSTYVVVVRRPVRESQSCGLQGREAGVSGGGRHVFILHRGSYSPKFDERLRTQFLCTACLYLRYDLVYSARNFVPFWAFELGV